MVENKTLDIFFKKRELEEKSARKSPSPTKTTYETLKAEEEAALEELAKIANKNREKNTSDGAFLLGIDYEPTLNKAVMKFYDVNTESVFIIPDFTGHKPYFLTDLNKSTVFEIAARKGMRSSIIEVTEIEKYDALQDKLRKLNKVVVKTPQDVGGGGGRRGLRSMIGEEHSWEARIRYYLCYLYDHPNLWPSAIHEIDGQNINVKIEHNLQLKKLESILDPVFSDLVKKYVPVIMQEIPIIKFFALDIEAGASPDKLPDYREPREPIIAVSIVWYDKDINDFSGEIYLLDRKRDLGDIHILEKGMNKDIGEIEVNGKKVTVYLYKSEKLMLIDLFKKLWDIPILVTFNGDNFDLNYMLSRANFLGIDKKLIPFAVKRSAELITADMKAGIHIDLYKFYSNGAIKAYVFKDAYETVSLDELASILLNERKLFLHVDFSKITMTDLARYNFWDAYLTAKLLAFNNWLPWRIMVILSRVTRYPLSDLTRRGVSGWIGNWFYAEMRERNWLIPNESDFMKKQELMNLAPRPQPVIKGKRYRGAIVFQPKAGTWFNVYVLDFASMYPAIIKVHNISFETVLCPHSECRKNKIVDLDYWVCTKNRGLASLLVGFIRDLRVKYYKKQAKKEQDIERKTFYSAVQSALKVLINASYGVFGAEIFSLYFLPVAESITAIGRQKILAIAQKARELNLDVIYGDTDSIFVHDPPEGTIDEIIEWAANELKIDLEIDKVYVFVSFSERKKNYFGLLVDGSLDIKGLLGKKRNTPEFLKREFIEVLKILKKVKSPSDMDKAKKEIEEKIISIYRKLSRGAYSLDDLAFRIMISKPIEKYTKTTPEHVKAAKKLRRKVKPGEIISYIKCRDGPWPVEILRKDANWWRKVDVEKYYEYTRSVFDQLLDALGIKIEELEKKARGLGDISQFFG